MPNTEPRAETAAPERRHLKALQRRLRYLDQLTSENPTLGYEQAERKAVAVAIQLFELYFAEHGTEGQQEGSPAQPTAVMLREAAGYLVDAEQDRFGSLVTEYTTLAEAMCARAQLLDEL